MAASVRVPLDDYDLQRQLGRPSALAQAEVWYALDPEGRPVVVKLLTNPLEAVRQRFSNEADCARKVVSPHVAQVWESGMTPQPYIVFEYVEGSDLTKIAPLRDQWEYLRTAEAIVAGLIAIHEQGIAHRDLKPDNVRYEGDGHAKIVDFGIALRKKADGHRQTVVPPGTQGWIAPERREERLLEVAEEQKCDIFSTGLLLSYLCTGIHPFDHDQRRIDNPNERPDLARVDEHLRGLLDRTLERDPAQRPEAKELLREILRLARSMPVRRRNKMVSIWKSFQKTTLLRKLIAVIAVVSLALVLFVVLVPVGRPVVQGSLGTGACPLGRYPPNSGDAVLRFGALLPRSGPLTAQGPQQFAAAELALNEVRLVGGVSGIQIESLSNDTKVDEGDPVSDIACASTDKLLMNRVDVIIGPATSAVTRKVIDRVTAAGVILFSPSNTAPEFTEYPDKGLYFRTVASDALQGRVLGKVISEDGNKSALVISRDDKYGNGLGQEIEKSLKLNNVNLLSTVKYNPGNEDFGSLAAEAVRRNPDAIVLIGFEETARVLASLRQEGITPRNKKIYGTDGNMRETLPVLVGPSGLDTTDGMRGTTRPQIDPAFAQRMNRSVGGGLVEFTYAAEVYDAVIISALAVAAAHSDNPTKIAEKINEVTTVGQKCKDYASCIDKLKQGIDIDYDGVSSLLEFSDAGEPCTAFYSVVEFDRDGKLVPRRTAEASNLCVKIR